MSHTPGPWVVRQDDQAYPNESFVNIKNGYIEIGGARHAREANARLIAAAPDLLAAAVAVVDRWDSPIWKDQPATAWFINDLRKAIAKASI